MPRSDSNYISDRLVDIRDRLKNYSKMPSNVQPDPAPAAGLSGVPEVSHPGPAADPAAVGAAALKRRTAEACRGRAELRELLASAAAGAGYRMEMEREQHEIMKRLEAELEALPEAPASDSPADVGRFFRDVENIRLEYLRTLARRGEAQAAVPANIGARGESVLPGYFGGRMWLGLAFSLPLIVGILLAALIAGGAFLIACGGF